MAFSSHDFCFEAKQHFYFEGVGYMIQNAINV